MTPRPFGRVKGRAEMGELRCTLDSCNVLSGHKNVSGTFHDEVAEWL